MPDFTAVTACNHPKLKDHEAVAEIINRYFVDPALLVSITFDDADDAHLCICGESWPEAWRVPEGTTAEDFDPYVEGIYEIGGNEFLELLQEIAPHLAEPLTVQAIGNVRCRFPLAASEWHIEPDGMNVEIRELASTVQV